MNLINIPRGWGLGGVADNGTWKAIGLTLIITLVLGAYGYAYSIDKSSVRRDELSDVLNRFDSRLGNIEVILMELRW